jgi:hypothetical protein
VLSERRGREEEGKEGKGEREGEGERERRSEEENKRSVPIA